MLALTDKALLPYKPRDFKGWHPSSNSAFGCKGLKFLQFASLMRVAPRAFKRRMTREADLSTQQAGAQTPPWLPHAHGHHGWPTGALSASCTRPQAFERLTHAPMERLRQRADFLAAASGQKAPTAGFILQLRTRPDAGVFRVGFTVSKKVGNAVERNRVRRRLREVVRLADAGIMHPGHDYVLIGRRAALSLPFQRISDDFKGALRRLRVSK